jgi:TolB protein
MSLGTGPEGEPSLSRDGRRLAYSTYIDNPDIVLLDLRTGERREIPGLREETTPVFAPDRTSVLFSSDRDGAVDLWLQRLDDGRLRGNPVQLTTEAGSKVVPAFSPDGRWIAYGRVVEDRRDIWIVPAGGGRTVPFVEDSSVEMHPAWSPDGSRLAFVSDRGGRFRVWVRGVSDGAPVGEARVLTSGAGADGLPAWSPDGASIAFLRGIDNASEVWTVGASDRPIEKQLTRGADARFLRWEGAGRSLVVSGTWGERAVRLRRVARTTGATVEFLPAVALGETSAAGDFDLSRDGALLAYTRYDRRGDIWLLEAGRGSF